MADTRDHSRVIPDGPTLVLEGFTLFGAVQVTSEAMSFAEAGELEMATASEMPIDEVPAPAPA